MEGGGIFQFCFLKKRFWGNFLCLIVLEHVAARTRGLPGQTPGAVGGGLIIIIFSGEVKPKSVQIQPMWASDHCMLMCDLERGGAVPGRFWKFNAELLGYPAFVEQFNEFYLGWRVFRGNFPSVLEWWEVVKQRIREFVRHMGWLRGERRGRGCASCRGNCNTGWEWLIGEGGSMERK